MAHHHKGVLLHPHLHVDYKLENKFTSYTDSRYLIVIPCSGIFKNFLYSHTTYGSAMCTYTHIFSQEIASHCVLTINRWDESIVPRNWGADIALVTEAFIWGHQVLDLGFCVLLFFFSWFFSLIYFCFFLASSSGSCQWRINYIKFKP